MQATVEINGKGCLTLLTEITGQTVVQVLVEVSTVSPLQPRAQTKVWQLHMALETNNQLDLIIKMNLFKQNNHSGLIHSSSPLMFFTLLLWLDLMNHEEKCRGNSNWSPRAPVNSQFKCSNIRWLSVLYICKLVKVRRGTFCFYLCCSNWQSLQVSFPVFSKVHSSSLLIV